MATITSPTIIGVPEYFGVSLYIRDVFFFTVSAPDDILELTGRLPRETQDLNAMTAESVWTEVWMRKVGEKDFKMINNNSFFGNE